MENPQQITAAAMKTKTTELVVMKKKTTELVVAKCDCCGLTEECTEAYIKRVRDHYSGRWVCGLCAEAVKDEAARSKGMIGTEEAMNRHMSFYRKFKKLSPPENSGVELISAVKQLLIRSLDSPRSTLVKKSGSLCSRSCRRSLS